MDKTSYRVLTLTVGCMLLLSVTAEQALAWPCTSTSCPDCYRCTETGCERCITCSGCCVCSGCSCVGGSCPACKSCVGCSCECTSECCEDSDCTGECHNGCSNCQCVDDDIKCSSIDCETCNEGVCEDECPALGKHCWYGECVECRDILDCELCYECENHECVHPCDECYYPKYCGYACACVECYPGPDDTTTCSGANSTTECDCSVNILNPCSSPAESVVYSGATLTSCTGPDCDSVDVLCYTTYPGCKVSGSVHPLMWCKANDVGPPTCQIILELPGPGCWDCVNSFESGDPTDEPQGECPTEAWP